MTEKANDTVLNAWEYTAESYLQAKTLAHKRMKKARPLPPFAGGWPTTYAMMMAWFDAAVDSEAVMVGGEVAGAGELFWWASKTDHRESDDQER